jgi:hypothetical protein
MKKYGAAFAFLATLFVTVASWAYHAYLVNNPAICYDQTFTVNLNTTPTASGTHHNISAQAIYSSSTFSARSFTDGSPSTGSFTVSSVVGLTSATATNRVTFAATNSIIPLKSSNTITVISTTGLSGAYVTFNNVRLRNGTEWYSTSTTTGTAASIATALARYNIIRVARVNSVIYTTAATAGIAGNNYTLSSSTPPAISVASAHFTGGQNSPILNAFVTVNGKKLRQGFEWYTKDTSSGTARSFASVLTNIAGINAVAVGSVVYATATASGDSANSYTMVSSSPSFITVLSPTFTGGKPNASVTINGYTVTQGTDWTAVATTTGTAQAITNAINAKAGLSSLVTASRSSSIVNLTSKSVGLATRYILSSSTPTAITASGPAMVSGTDSAITINSPTISLPSHGFGTGLAVVYTTSTLVLGGLTSNTTYYAYAATANTIKLATTTFNAVNGPYVTITSSSTTGPHTFTLTPPTITGTPGFFWEVSNDNVNYNPVDISSVTFPSPYTATSTQWDLGTVPQKYLRLNVTAPTTGGLNLQVILNGSN